MLAKSAAWFILCVALPSFGLPEEERLELGVVQVQSVSANSTPSAGVELDICVRLSGMSASRSRRAALEAATMVAVQQVASQESALVVGGAERLTDDGVLVRIEERAISRPLRAKARLVSFVEGPSSLRACARSVVE